MNKELIRQLIDDAKLTAVSEMFEDDLQKFAQLIIAECMAQVEGQYLPVLEDEALMRDPHWSGYVQCGVDSHVAIREHFYGVEL